MIGLLVVNAILQDSFFQPAVMSSTFRSMLPLILVAVGQAFIILGADIDLSLGSIIAMTNVSVVQMIEVFGHTPGGVLLAMGLGLVVATGAGFINGVLISYFRLTPIITTFATATIFEGIALWIMPSPGGNVPRFYYEIYSGDFIGLPLVFWIVGGLLLLHGLYISKTRFYRHLFATGGNKESAFQTGVPVPHIRLMSYTLGGLFAGLATLCIIGETASGDPLIGPSYTLNSISAVVLGGTALAGGIGGIVGPVFGAVIMETVNNVIFFARVPVVMQTLLQGIIVIVALAIGGLSTKRGARNGE
jgi:ribose transport system permease protein